VVKTRLEWLNDLPYEYKVLALSARDEKYDEDFFDNLADASYEFCSWSKTPQGDKFWREVWNILENNDPLPPLSALAHLRNDVAKDEYPDFAIVAPAVPLVTPADSRIAVFTKRRHDGYAMRVAVWLPDVSAVEEYETGSGKKANLVFGGIPYETDEDFEVVLEKWKAARK
jgi:hypothetical protein